MDPYIGEVRMFAGNFAPVGWLICDGSSQSISQYSALYQLIGATYGGDGQLTFNLPDLRGRTPIHQGQGRGLSPRTLGDLLGSETVSLTAAQMPAHFHAVGANSGTGDISAPAAGCIWSTGSTGEKQYSKNAPTASMSPAATTAAGNGAPHNNMMPFQAVSFIIATEGIYPAQ